MSTDMQIALVGVIGTLAGTVLGWLLNNLSQSGKLNIYVSSFEDSFQHSDNIGCMVPSSSIEETEHYSYKLILDLYNSSGTAKIMRNITIVFSDGKKDLLRSVPNDNYTRRSSGHACFYDEIGPVNIPPKSIIQLNLHRGAWRSDGGLDFIWKTQKVYLTYLDENNKLKKFKIKTEIYRDYFDNHKAEEKENG